MNDNRPLGRMLVSKAKGREVDIDASKVATGSFYTTRSNWLTDQVRQFLTKALNASNGNLLDPFAGDGHLLEAISKDKKLGKQVAKAFGFDIQGEAWPVNDSLIAIPNPNKATIVTNPPYLANHSAKRKGVDSLVKKYFEESGENNLYKIALANSLAVADYVIAIIPETFFLSSFPKERLELMVVVEDQLFGDTEAPAVVACFGPNKNSQARVFVGDKFIGDLSEILSLRAIGVATKIAIKFNTPKGRIGLRAVDGSDGKTAIAFLPAKEFNYREDKVLVSSRLMTYLEIAELRDSEIAGVIAIANQELARIRKLSSDLVLAPFKGNDRDGVRRRRLDYALARRILKVAIAKARKG